MAQPTILVHGGAGTMAPGRLTPERRAEITDGLRRAVRAGQRVLLAGGPALHAVVAAVTELEDDPRFNAGRGAVFTSDETHEMDAAVMDGATARAGAVASVMGPRNPVQAARLVMERSPHVVLTGPGALRFLQSHAVPFEDASYFGTEERRAALAAMRERPPSAADDFDRHGTVGAVALDRAGHLAAATSTGGRTGKAPGRVGDTPIPGAGTWADTVCAVSATGHGESFIRAAAAHEISARIRLAGQDLASATSAVLDLVVALGGSGGLIAIDRDGQTTLPFTTRGMYRGRAVGDAPPEVAIYAEELAP